MKKGFTFFVFLLFSLPLFSQNLRSYQLDKVIQQRTKAVIKVTVFDKNLKVLTTGAAFFIGSKGEFLTSDHLIREFLKNGDNKIQFKLFDGKFLSTVSILGCKNENNIDACLLIDKSQKKGPHFPKSNIKIGRGHQVAMIGFCDSDKHSSKKGLIKDYFDDINSKFRTSEKAYNQKVKMVQTDVSQCPGDSGGPLFNYSGELVGMATNIFKSTEGKKQFNLSIHSNELMDFVRKLKIDQKEISVRRILKTSKAKAKLLKLIN